MAVTTYFYAGPGMLIGENRNGTKKAYRQDAWGSTSQMTDINGNITDTFEFDYFGNQIARTGSTATPIRWRSTSFTLLNSNFYQHNPIYDATVGLFIQAHRLMPGRDNLREQARRRYGGFVSDAEFDDCYRRAWRRPVLGYKSWRDTGGEGPSMPWNPGLAPSYGHPKAPRQMHFSPIYDDPAFDYGSFLDCLEALYRGKLGLRNYDPFSFAYRSLYGNFCGYWRRGLGEPGQERGFGQKYGSPIDCIDVACCIHDNCLGSFGDVANPTQRFYCGQLFCKMAKQCVDWGCDQLPGPSRQQCVIMAQMVMSQACDELIWEMAFFALTRQCPQAKHMPYPSGLPPLGGISSKGCSQIWEEFTHPRVKAERLS